MSEHRSSYFKDSIVWDAHACIPLRPGEDLSPLERHRAAGATFVSINVGMDFNPIQQIIRVIAGYRDWIARHPEHYIQANTVADVIRAKQQGKLAVAFDLEGSVMLDDDLAMLRLYRDLGVRQIHLAYNRDNSISGGCHGNDRGLTDLGRAVVREINAVGMLMDCAHSSRQSSLEIMELSSKPVVFSHGNAKGVKNHPRNIDDDQMAACARTDGVIGISGIGIFLGDNDIATETVVRHVEYIAERIGTRHIGIGLDFVFDQTHSDLPPEEDSDKWWPRSAGYDFDTLKIVPPEQIPQIAEALLRRGYAEEAVTGILGGNFLRAAMATWPA